MSAGCPHCGSLEIGKSWGETRYACGMSSGYPPEVRFSECLRREAAALRRQVEERGDAIPEFDVNKLDGLEGAWAEGNLRVYIAGARAGWGKCASLIRIPPGDVVATPPPDVVTVPREEWDTKCAELASAIRMLWMVEDRFSSASYSEHRQIQGEVELWLESHDPEQIHFATLRTSAQAQTDTEKGGA